MPMLKHPVAMAVDNDPMVSLGARWGGKGGGSAPAAPDPNATAAAQQGINKEAVRESARVNQINQVTPTYSINWTGEIGSPERTQTTQLNPQQQAIFDQQQGIAGGLTNFASEYVPRVQDALSTPFSTENLQTQAPVANSAERQRIEQNYFDRLNPQLDRDRDRLDARLATQGINLGTEAYSNAMDDFNRGVADTRLAAANAAGSEYSRGFDLQGRQRQQELSDALLNRTQGINEVTTLLGGAPAFQQPGAQQNAQYNVAPADYQGAAALGYQGQLNAYNQQQQQRGAALGGLAGLAGTLGAAAIPAIFPSDRRLKRDVSVVGHDPVHDLPVYSFRYLWEDDTVNEHIGYMADEVRKVRPDCVITLPSGYDAVNYGELV